MYCVSYKFTLLSNNSETRRQFIEIWSGLTDFFREHCGALGSRLHYGDDGFFYAYAQWPCPSEVLWEGEVVADMLV